MEQPVSEVVAIRKYFFNPEESATDIIKEIKELTPEDRAELAEGAAKELGLTLKKA